jgi:glycosyltransferase involved in cell wall biosynthesis
MISAASHEPGKQNGRPPRSRRAKVMLFIDSFNVGGTERQMVQCLRLLDRNKYQLLAGCMRRVGQFLSEVEAMGIPVVECRIPSLGSARAVIELFKLARFLRRERVDLLHAFDYYTNLFAVPAARLAGLPVVLASRRSLADDRNAVERMVLDLACRMAHGTVANSAMAGRIAAGPPERVCIIHNSIDPHGYRTEPPSLQRRRSLGLQDIAEQEKWVGVLARLRPEKGHRTFLRAAARVYAAFPQARFVLMGDGPEQAALKSLARELGIAGRVVFAGDCRNVSDWLCALDLVVLPSNEESLPNAVLEAMAAARAVVATRVGGTPELIEEGVNGYLVPAADPEAMAARILELLENDALRLRMGHAGRARVERDFTPALGRKKLEALYDRLLGPSLGAPSGDPVTDGQTEAEVGISSRCP